MSTGVLLLAKNKPAFIALANLFSSEKAPHKISRARARRAAGKSI